MPGERREKPRHIDRSRVVYRFRQADSARNVPNLVFLNCCQSGASLPWSSQHSPFRDLARKLLDIGVPDVVATLTPVFDKDSQIFMLSFFASLLRRYNAAEAVARARQALSSKSLNTFYQYIHLSQTDEGATITWVKSDMEVEKAKHYFASPNHPSLDMNFVNRNHIISQIEASYKNGAKAVMVSGMGGAGKTALSVMLEKRLVKHYDPKLKVNQTVWLDLREKYSFGEFIEQIATVLHSAGNPFAAKTLKDAEDVDSLTVCRLLANTFGDTVLFTLDNCENLLDEQGKPKDLGMFRFILGLIAHTTGWKILLTTREPFDLTIDNRTLFTTHKCLLGSLTYTERVALLESLLAGSNLQINIQDEDKVKVIREVAGNPYELILFIHELTPLSEIDYLIKQTHRRTGEYAYLDYYVGKLDHQTLALLHLMTAFATPPTKFEIQAVAKVLKKFKNLDITRTLESLVNTGLVEKAEEFYSIPPVLAFYLTQDNPHSIDKKKYDEYSQVITLVYLRLYQISDEKLKKALSNGGLDKASNINPIEFAIKGLRQSFLQPDVRLPVRLLSLVSEKAPGRLSLREMMEHALQVETKLRNIDRSPEISQVAGSLYHQVGMVYEMQRQWEKVLENYAQAIEWNEKTQQYHELGGSYHQVGRVYQMQRQWEKATKAYNLALQLYMKYAPESPDIQILLGSIVRLYEEMRKRGEEIPGDLKQIVMKIGLETD